MLFTGHSEHTIDAKLRLAIPAKYRNQWDPVQDGGAWYCIPWPTGHVRLYTEATFKQLALQGANTLAPQEAQAGLESSLYGFSERVEMDSAGRIMIPKSHMEWTGLSSEVVVVGARVRLEVHNRAAWNATARQRFESLPDLIARLGSGPSRPGTE